MKENAGLREVLAPLAPEMTHYFGELYQYRN